MVKVLGDNFSVLEYFGVYCLNGNEFAILMDEEQLSVLKDLMPLFLVNAVQQ